MGSGFTETPSAILLGRLLTAIFGCATVFLVYLCGTRLFDTYAAGLFGAIFLAVSPTAVMTDRIMLPDPLQAFFMLLTLWAAILLKQTSQTKYYFMAGGFAAAAAAIKYIGVIAILSLALSHFVRKSWGGLLDKELYKELRIYLSALFCVATFLLLFPFIIFDFVAVLSTVAKQLYIYSTGHDGAEGNTLLFYIKVLGLTEGPPAIIGAAFMLYALWRRWRLAAVASIVPIIYFIYVAGLEVRFGRTILPVIPFLCMFAGGALAYFYRWLTAKTSSKKWVWFATAVLTAAFAMYPAWITVAETSRLLVEVRNQEASRIWIIKNLPSGTSIAIESYAPYIDPKKYKIVSFGSMIQGLTEIKLSAFRRSGVKYFIFAERMYGRYFQNPDRYPVKMKKYLYMFETLEQVKIFHGGNADIRVYRFATE